MKTYIPCVVGNNPFAECLVEARGNLIRFSGHATMDFAPADVVRLADWLQQVAAPLAGSPAPAATLEKPSLLERFRVLFPDDNWQAGDLDLNTMAESARDLCLSLALTLETVRQRSARASDDGH